MSAFRRILREVTIAAGLAMAAISGASWADPEVPDYDDPRYWSQVAGELPEGAAGPALAPWVDVFYIHPTTTKTRGQFNHDPLDPEVLTWTDESAIARQASAFNGCCRVFAPRYRAATSGALFSDRMKDHFAIAYGDIERAFDHYLAHDNNGRPFILAGHSQGGAHVATLLEKRIEGSAIKDRLVAAYVIGINLAEGDFGTRFPTLGPCAEPDGTGCVVQWNAVLAGSDLAAMRNRFEAEYRARTGGGEGARTLCVNPVSFAADRPLTLSAEARGAVAGDPGTGVMQALKPGAVAAQCDDGILKVWLAPGLDLVPMPGGSMHYHDIGLFWADVRENVKARSAQYLKAIRQSDK